MEQAHAVGSALAIIGLDSRAPFSTRCINVIECFLIDKHPYAKILKKHGFIPRKRKNFSLMFSSFGIEKEIKELASSPPEKVYLSYGDIFLTIALT